MMQRLSTLALVGLAIGLAACGEQPQTTTTKKSDSKPWESAATAYTTGSWKAGDQPAWEAQLRTRSQIQNEYSRAPAQP